MSVILREPIKDKHTEQGEFGELLYVSSAMQGWRVTMEDAHIATELKPPPNFEKRVLLFAVFDGHGGNEVSKFCQNHYAQELMESEAYKVADFEQALRDCMHRMDDMLRMKIHRKELFQYRKELQKQEGDPVKFLENQLAAVKSDLAEIQQRLDALKNPNKPVKKAESKQPVNLSPEEEYELKERRRRLEDLIESKTSFNGEHFPAGSKEANERSIAALEGLVKSLENQIKEIKSDLAARKTSSGNEEEILFDLDSGATAIVALIAGDVAYVANVGDSRAIVCRKGYAHPLSKDHKPLVPEELKRIEKAGGFVTPVGRVCNYLNLSRAIGDLRYKDDPYIPQEEQIITAEPDVRTLEITKDHQFLVLACDGVWDVLSNQDVAEFILHNLEGKRPAVIVEELLDGCLAENLQLGTGGIGGDNMTCIIVFLHPISRILADIRQSSMVSIVYRRVKNTLARS